MCIFCQIIDGKIPNKTILEDENFLAFEDINPVAKIHALIIPKTHIKSFNEITPEIMGNMTTFIQKVAKELDVVDAGYRLVTNIGKDGGQEVEHIHFHLLAGESMGAIR